MFKKFLLTQGKLFPRTMFRQIHCTQEMARNAWPHQVSISLWFQTYAQNYLLSLSLLVQIQMKFVWFILCIHSLWFYDVIFSSWSCVLLLQHNVFCYIFYTDPVKLLFIMGVNFLHLSIIWYFSTLFFSINSFALSNNCTLISVFVLSTSVKLNISPWKLCVWTSEMSIGLNLNWTGSGLWYILLILDRIRTVNCFINLGSEPYLDWVNGK